MPDPDEASLPSGYGYRSLAAFPTATPAVRPRAAAIRDGLLSPAPPSTPRMSIKDGINQIGHRANDIGETLVTLDGSLQP